MARHPRHSPGLTYLARHGQTEWNVAGRRQGRLDSPLTPLGLEQARQNARLLLDEGIDAIFASPLGRAHRTASLIASELGLSVQVVEDLAEIDHGLWSGLGSAEIDARWPGQRDARERDKYTYRFPEGESYADGEVRAGRVLAEIERSGVRRPLLVSHEMIGRMLLRQLGVPEALATRQPSDLVYRVRAGGVVEGLSSSG
ncbi:histidine phosphatase family protein [Kribbella speibonae]|uniref:Histidine phosphatase family protein n=1 Tax=Kribbella speibonae TaxID=1572660 RepID=A0ABY2A1D3_9ACTN|nr:histidine phosphatase family protein [Kribbella speibonae]TCC20159.1 histidine phosphatase family protein [Kribbella speibonae]